MEDREEKLKTQTLQQRHQAHEKKAQIHQKC